MIFAVTPHLEYVMAQMSRSAHQVSRAEANAFRQKLLEQLQNSYGSEVSSSYISPVFDKNQMSANNVRTSDLSASVSVHDSESAQTEVRSRKRPSVKDVNGLHNANSMELNELSTAAAAKTSPPVQRNRGHVFVSASLQSPTWCDRCGDFIWGVYKQCLICTSECVLTYRSV